MRPPEDARMPSKSRRRMRSSRSITCEIPTTRNRQPLASIAQAASDARNAQPSSARPRMGIAASTVLSLDSHSDPGRGLGTSSARPDLHSWVLHGVPIGTLRYEESDTFRAG
jgi:hypothetical protein